MDGKYWLAQTYSTQSKRFRECNENREGWRGLLRSAGSSVANAALTGQFAASQGQRFINRFGHNARLRVRLFSAGRWGRVLIVFSHSVFP
jgi:hypothetical protein